MMSLVSALSLNDKLALNAQLAAVIAEAEAAPAPPKEKYCITAEGLATTKRLAKGLKEHAFRTPLKVCQGIPMLNLFKDSKEALSKADLVEALEETDFMKGCKNKGGAPVVVRWWLTEFEKRGWIAKAE